MEERICIHALIQGRVQGVFFRKETKRQADALQVTGWVKNRADGSVEALFEGRRQDVEAVISWCDQGPPAADVKRVETTETPCTEAFDAFSIAW